MSNKETILFIARCNTIHFCVICVTPRKALETPRRLLVVEPLQACWSLRDCTHRLSSHTRRRARVCPFKKGRGGTLGMDVVCAPRARRLDGMSARWIERIFRGVKQALSSLVGECTYGCSGY